MSTFKSSDIRNFALVGHGTSGKTVLSEAMLYNGGETNRIGKIEDGTTISDYHINETSRQISISTALLQCEWEGKRFNILDAPGFLDFMGEARSALHVADFALVAVPVVSGPEAGTDLVWKYAEERKIPKLIVVTMLNKEHSKFDTVVQELTDHFSKRIFPFLLPMNAGPGFNQIADVLRRKMLTYRTDGSGKYEEDNLPDEWQDRVDQLHEELIEYIAESDDSLLEKFF